MLTKTETERAERNSANQFHAFAKSVSREQVEGGLGFIKKSGREGQTEHLRGVELESGGYGCHTRKINQHCAEKTIGIYSPQFLWLLYLIYDQF